MAEADNLNERRKLKKKILPQGTSDYQAAWIVDDTDEEDSNDDEDEDGGDRIVLDDRNNECLTQLGSDHSDIEEEFNTTRDIDADTETDTVMGDDDNLTAEQIKAEIERIKNAHADDEEFPDELDTSLNIPARRRFAKFRGLKSFSTSSWDPKESLPQDYGKIFAFDNFTRTQKHALAKVAETDDSNSDESVPVGSYVRLHVKQVSVEVANRICSLSKRLPITVSGLLQHESNMSVLHFRCSEVCIQRRGPTA